MYKPEEVTHRTHWDAAAEMMWHAVDLPHLIWEEGGGGESRRPLWPPLFMLLHHGRSLSLSHPVLAHRHTLINSIIHKSSNMRALKELALSVSCSLKHTHAHLSLRRPHYIVCSAWSGCNWLYTCKHNDTFFSNYLVGSEPEGCWD